MAKPPQAEAPEGQETTIEDKNREAEPPRTGANPLSAIRKPANSSAASGQTGLLHVRSKDLHPNPSPDPMCGWGKPTGQNITTSRIGIASKTRS